MAKSIKVLPKRRGRPATGKDPFVGVRLPPSLIEAIDTWAEASSVTRSEAMRRLIEAGLERAKSRG
jgi:predicted DNA-binding protein